MLKKIIGVILVLLFLPIGLTVGISGTYQFLWEKEVDYEMYLPMILCEQISWDYEMETLKAQAVLARSSLYLCGKRGEISPAMWKTILKKHQAQEDNRRYQNAYDKMELAVKETKGQVLVCGNQICEGVFHKVSGGTTRDGVEVMKSTSYAYLPSRECEADVCADGYLHGHYFSLQALQSRLEDFGKEKGWENQAYDSVEILERDSQGYVTKVGIGSNVASGEEFRLYMNLSSGNFSIQEVEGKVRFLCKGVGHGFGMSQFGANQLAKQGNSYHEILSYFFSEIEIVNLRDLEKSE